MFTVTEIKGPVGLVTEEVQEKHIAGLIFNAKLKNLLDVFT